MINYDDVYKIGRIGKPHGVKGEVAFRFTDDVFDTAGADCLFLGIDGILVPFFIDEYRFHGGETALVKFFDVDTREQADAIVGHDVHVGRHTQISAYSHIAGYAELGERCYLGVRASVREECRMGDDVVLAMGAVVMEKRVPSRVLAMGNPAKYVRRKAGSKVFS